MFPESATQNTPQFFWPMCPISQNIWNMLGKMPYKPQQSVHAGFVIFLQNLFATKYFQVKWFLGTETLTLNVLLMVKAKSHAQEFSIVGKNTNSNGSQVKIKE